MTPQLCGQKPLENFLQKQMIENHLTINGKWTIFADMDENAEEVVTQKTSKLFGFLRKLFPNSQSFKNVREIYRQARKMER
jgi:hypothetical protein